MAMLEGLVATQVKVIQLNFSCQLTLEFQSDVTGPQQQTQGDGSDGIWHVLFENAVKKKKSFLCHTIVMSWH